MSLGAVSLLSFAFVVLLVQAATIVVWLAVVVPPAPTVLIASGATAAVLADVLTTWVTTASLTGLAISGAAGFFVAIGGQLLLGQRREQVTVALAQSLTLVAVVISTAAAIVVRRHFYGPKLLLAGLAAVTVGLVVANLLDHWKQHPEVHPAVPRGIVGGAAGVLASTLVYPAVLEITRWSGFSGVDVFAIASAALAGLVIGAVVLLVDLGVAYERAGRPMMEQRGDVHGWQRWTELAVAPLISVATSGAFIYTAAALLTR